MSGQCENPFLLFRLSKIHYQFRHTNCLSSSVMLVSYFPTILLSICSFLFFFFISIAINHLFSHIFSLLQQFINLLCVMFSRFLFLMRNFRICTFSFFARDLRPNYSMCETTIFYSKKFIL